MNRITVIYIRSVIMLLLFITGITGQAFGQSCASNLFVKSYVFPGYNYAGFLDTLPNGNFMWGGTKSYKLYIANSDNMGTPSWSKIYSCTPGGFQDNQASAVLDVNGNYFVALDLNYVGLLDATGTPVSAKHLTIPQDVLDIKSIAVLPNNQKIILAKDNSTYAGEGYLLICLSADLSAVIWQRHMSGSLFMRSMKIVGNDIYVLGLRNNQGLLTKYDQWGNVLVKKEYQIDNKPTTLTNIYPYLNGYIVTAVYSGGETNNSILLRLDNNFDITESFRFTDVQQNASMALAVEPEGDFHGLWCTGFGISQGLFYIGKYNEILWSRGSVGNNAKKLLNTPDGLAFFSIFNYFDVVAQSSMSGQILTKTDGNGLIQNCYGYNSPFQLAAISNSTSSSSLSPRDTSMVMIPGATITAVNNPITILDGCTATSTCSNLDIMGNTSSCSNDTLLYIARRNPGCLTPVKWSLTGGNAYQQQWNDSTIAIRFLQSGTYQLIARLGQACQIVNDTMTIQITVIGQLPPLNLGPSDTLLCSNNIIRLNAHSGYVTYTWQDGATDSVYTVTQPGTYYVTVTDACGGIQSDTIRVTSYPPISFNAGPDRVKCNADTIHINTTGGFSNYQWQPAYNINTATSQNVIVYPYVDTTYTVMAEKFPGCFVFDTVQVTVKHSPVINLGQDKNLCGGDSTIADAGPGFNQYLWSNGAATQQVTLFAAGTYTVAGTFANGCVSQDTVTITAFPNPVVTLNHLATLCMGESRLLDAGNFTAYLWNDGSTKQNLLINSTGIYFVTVTDANGCKDTDSTEIKILLPSPKNFLPGDTSLCVYSSLKLIADPNYMNYLWNNSTTGQSISITQPGLYWLEVTDYNSCRGRDSINIISKQCLRGLFVPNAFTPNGDAKNDLLKPSLFGTVKQYEFIVYNRYGEVVFRTSDPARGWDGRVKGKIQNQGTFVWACIYQIDNQILNTEYGTVILIR